ncbi:triose-phosphate isomerase [Periweissella beninensis]|uniref:Triosephosphate isomerase n=1 Tax=Periweissella beninensis TaxID=504936 RepID=A0ABT0VKD8_9LACO|nr:triose-phosphate isomerase [Periweissella beninensis]MBM7544657.1 triosephosphate isomerase [Periweissella beninensis]MCM2436900.1 triose-phosphate isomerase [Periweissella beninensis]MCT4397034.1 triose-phosphate isomerase [Periweissella beninensis]
MRIPFVAANWKMNKTLPEALEFLNAIRGQLPPESEVESLICAQSLFLSQMLFATSDQPLKIGAENVYWKDSGAYTGETSPKALASLGVDYVIIGHSERRKYFRETDEMINNKVQAVLKNNMLPIICVDETMGQREANEKVHWVVSQVIEALKGVSPEEAQKITIAYEPSWAIGTAAATAKQAEDGCYLIRQTIADMFSDECAEQVRILYGGSVKPNNQAELMAMPNIDGVLVGDASLDPAIFLKLVNYQKEV